MWLTGQCGSTFGLWLASPAGAVRGDNEYWSPSSAWHGDGWWACCVGGAGRDLRHVGSGLVQTGQLAGISGCAGLLWVGWRAAEVVTELSQAARNMVGRKQMR
jgi:hypothetical protein